MSTNMKEKLVSKEQTILEQIEERSLVLYNDDVNTFDHVIQCLMRICKHSAEAAEQCAYIVHYSGKCSIKHGEYSKLEAQCTALLDQGLSAVIE
ncbi:MAG: ATP-dependent Clp protease adaptor ClpS [Flavobacteriia bacterium]|nr:ATP-dependent Clp protease adaptor ClpS [Flavobacteriia bacterium]